MLIYHVLYFEAITPRTNMAINELDPFNAWFVQFKTKHCSLLVISLIIVRLLLCPNQFPDCID
mgnify:FL=1